MAVSCPLPNQIPSPLYIVLSRGNNWLDYYHRDTRWPIASQAQENVTFEYGDDASELQALIDLGEGVTIEFKDKIPDNADQMFKTVAAFANGDGGIIILGVRDGTAELTGIGPDVARLQDKLTNMVRNNVFPEPAINFQSAEIDHRTVLAMYVKPGAGVIYGIHQTNTLYFVRRGATTFPARPEELTRIMAARVAAKSLPCRY